MATSEMDHVGLKSITVQIHYKLGKSSQEEFVVKVNETDTLKNVEKHITTSLDTPGKLIYREHRSDEYPTKRLSDFVPRDSEDETIYLLTERKSRNMNKHSIQLQVSEEFGDKKKVDMKIARITTFANLKHKIQDRLGIPVQRQSIHVLGQKEPCPLGVNVMQVPQPQQQPIILEIKLPREDVAVKPDRKRSTQINTSKSKPKEPIARREFA